jgi:GTP-binding nuclear protein Ran
MQINEYKVSIIGKNGIGKTSFLRRLNNTYKETNNYIPTLGVEVIPIDLHGEFGKIRLNFWDNAGDERYRGLKDKYHITPTDI